MRLLRLAMCAFGPYAASEEVDFRKLGDRSFFLICGPTGAGKSSILDAICYALYGETSGKDRDPGRMRSDFADARTETFVTLEFALRHRIYRVARQPIQQRQAQRGQQRLVEIAAKALLEEIAADGGRVRVLGESVREVDERVVELLGFDVEQFRQIVMLPQGKFQKLLLCPSGDREKILEVLFGTELYRRVQERLREQAARLRHEWELLDARRQAMLEQAGVADAAALQEQVADLDRMVGELAGAAARLREVCARQQEELQSAHRAIEKLGELESARVALAALTAREEEIGRRRAALQAATTAAGLADIEAIAAQKERDAAAADGRLEELTVSCARADKEAARARSELLRETQRESERSTLGDQLRQLAAAVPAFEALARAEAEFAGTDGDWRTSAEAQERLDKETTQWQGSLAKAAEQLEKTRAESKDLRFLTARARDLEKLLGARTRLEDARKHLKTHNRQHAHAAKQVDEIEQRLEASRRKLELLETRWVAGQASRLGATLVAGEPCPVCGSTKHPKPAKGRGAAVGDAELDEARAELKRIEKETKSAQRDATASERELSRLQERIEGLETTLGDDATRSLGNLQTELQQATAQRDAAGSAVQRLEKQEESLADGKERLAELESSLRKVRAETDELRQRRTRTETQVAERRTALPAGIADRGALDRRMHEVEGRRADLQAALERATKANEQAQKTLVEAQTSLRAQHEQAEAARKEQESATTRFATRVKQAGFESTQAYRAARLDGADRGELERGVGEFDASLAAARERLNRAKDAAGELARPDLAALESAIEVSRRQLDGAIAEERSARDRLAALSKVQTDLVKQAVELAGVEARHDVMNGLAELARGRNARRITLQQFVLTTILNDVLHAANRRYGPMTRGRYRLLRIDATTDGRGGLDLAVFDGNTNQSRPASTLSGGEVFQASLALALGLADEVMARAGGIQLDTTFIDEGFGSLDSESLDLAIRWLLDLQEAGRTVGVISHVPELRERIETRLEVIPSPTGSRTKFVV